MLNFTLYEDGNGGQMVLQNNEILQTESLATLAYLLMFGGNVAAKTQQDNPIGELRIDWWGNDPTENSEKWINSETEKVLKGIEISSQSLYTIQQAVINDTKSLEQYGNVTVLVSFPNLNRVSIEITIEEPSKINGNRLIIVWDATRNEIIRKDIL